MIIKKYLANTESEAIIMAKEDLGKDAVVMNIKIMKPKGIYKLFQKSKVEITAALDDVPAPASNEDRIIAEIQKLIKQTDPSVVSQVKAIEVETEAEKEFEESAIEKKLNSLQSLLEKQMKGSDSEEKKEYVEENGENMACVQLIYNQLIHNEVDEKYANQLIGEIEKSLKKDVTVDNVLSSIYQKIILKLGQTKTIQIKEGCTKYIFFIGPTGVGKTTTIAKIASSLSLRQKAKIALITSDTYRIAAVDQLKTYANILGLPLKIVYQPEDLLQVKEELSEFDLVLVDTAGRSHHNEEQKKDLQHLIETIPEEEKEVYLVLSATTKYNDLIKIALTYKEITKFNLVFTKLDETECIGNIYNLKILTGAPLSYTTFGQNVPDDIGRLNAQGIAKKLLGGSD